MASIRVLFKSFLLTIPVFCALELLAQPQGSAQDNRIRNLFSADPSTRGEGKTELSNHPDPTLLPALLQALPSVTGSNRDDLLEVLAKYDDVRKIPVFVTIMKSGKWDTGWPPLSEQLAKLGAPAAQAILDGCAGAGEDYGDWAGTTIGWMQETGIPFLIEAVESDDTCKHTLGATGLAGQYGDADIHSVSRADLELASNAVIDPDERIRMAARDWFDSWKGNEKDLDFSGIVEALIAAYQAQAPPETMLKIAKMLSEPDRPRVTRFMRAAVNSPNPDIQQIAHEYLLRLPPEAKPSMSGAKKPKTPEAKIAHLEQLTTTENANAEIIAAIEDANARVRAKAAEALGLLNAATTDSRDEREPDPETALPALRRALKDSSPEVRAAAIDALDMMRSNDDAASLVAALHDPDPSVVLAAAKAISDIPDVSAAPVLTGIYQSEKSSAELRFQALQSLAIVCDASSTPVFVQALETPTGVDFSAAQGLLCTLTRKPDASAFEALRQALERAPALVTQEYLIRAIGASKNPAALPILETIAKSHHPVLAPRAAEAMGLQGDRRAIAILAELLGDSNPNIRLMAAWSLTKFSDFTAPPELLRALTDPDSGVRTHASNALIESHDPKAIDALIAILPDPMAIYPLGQSRNPRACPALLAVLKNPAIESAQRAQAATALGALGDPCAIDPLISALNEDNPSISAQASYALAALKDQRAIPPLQQALERWRTGQRPNAESVKNFIMQALLALGGPEAIPATGSRQ